MNSKYVAKGEIRQVETDLGYVVCTNNGQTFGRYSVDDETAHLLRQIMGLNAADELINIAKGHLTMESHPSLIG